MHKSYFTFIQKLQEAMLVTSIAILVIVPPTLAYLSQSLPENIYSFLFGLSLGSVTLVMAVRPFADLLAQVTSIRPLVMLRKGFGVFSASIIVAIMLSRVMADGLSYIAIFIAPSSWNVMTGAFLSPVGDLAALILLITSNRFSKRVLGRWWKRIQKLSYVYFCAGVLYEYVLLNNQWAFLAGLLVTTLVLAAHLKNRTQLVPQPA